MRAHLFYGDPGTTKLNINIFFVNAISRYILFYLAASFFFIVYNHILDLIFFSIEYGRTDNLINGLGYIGYFIAIYTPIFLPFLVVYNIVVNQLFSIRIISREQKIVRYLSALVLGSFIGLLIGRAGISVYIGEYRPVKNVLLFGMIMLSLEITRDLIVGLRNKNRL